MTGNPNNPGVVRKRLSGQQSGVAIFDIPGNCSAPWLGIYYIKDSSVSKYGDYAGKSGISTLNQTPLAACRGPVASTCDE